MAESSAQLLAQKALSIGSFYGINWLSDLGNKLEEQPAYNQVRYLRKARDRLEDTEKFVRNRANEHKLKYHSSALPPDWNPEGPHLALKTALEELIPILDACIEEATQPDPSRDAPARRPHAIVKGRMDPAELRKRMGLPPDETQAQR